MNYTMVALTFIWVNWLFANKLRFCYRIIYKEDKIMTVIHVFSWKIIGMIFLAVVPLVSYYGYIFPMLEENRGMHCLPDHFKHAYHQDYLVSSFLKIPWVDTAFCGIDPPYLLAGNQTYDYWAGTRYVPKPVPLPKQWQVSYAIVNTSRWKIYLPYAAFTTKGMYHARIGWRWDDNDQTYNPSISFKKIAYHWERILWYRYVC